MADYHTPDEDFYRKLDVALPKFDTHGTEDDIRANLKQIMPHKWTQRGNQLIGETDMGPLVQTIPTDYILTGTDAKGLPVFKKINL